MPDNPSINLETTSTTSSQDDDPHTTDQSNTNQNHDSPLMNHNSPTQNHVVSARSRALQSVDAADSEAELVQKTGFLEEELSELQQKTDSLREEREALEQRIQEKDENLIQVTADLETESDTLADARRELREKRNEVLMLQKRNQTMGEMSALNQLTEKRQGMAEERQRKNVTELDDDSMQKIVDLTNELRMKGQHKSDLQHEIDTLTQVMEKKVNAVNTLDKQVKEYQWKEDRAYELECTNNELTYQVENLEKETKTLDQITRMKSQTIEKLNAQVAQWNELKEEHAETQKKLDYKQQQLDDLNAELKQIQEDNAEKEREINRILDSRDIVPIRTLESDKAFLSDEMKKKKDEKSTLQKTIKWQEKQIQMLQSRLQSLNYALKETKLLRMLKKQKRPKKEGDERPDSDQVPIHLYLLMVHDLQNLEKKAKSLELLLDEKNDVAESLESKLDQYENDKSEETKAFKKEAQDLRRQIANVNQQIGEAEERYKMEENELKARNISIKKKLFSIHPRASSQQGTPRVK